MIENEIWKQIGDVGHTYWSTENKPERIAVADRSMRIRNQPGSTDDGLQLLDRRKWIVLSHRDQWEWCIKIPLIKPNGNETQTLGSCKEAVFLAQTFGMRISICGVLFEPSKIGCAVPGCDMLSVTHALISISGGPKELHPLCKCHVDAALEDEPF